MSLTDVAHKLRNLNLVTEVSYQEITRLIEQGAIQSRSALLRQLEQDAVKFLLAAFGLGTGAAVNFGVADFTNEMRSELLKLLDKLRESDVVSQGVYEKLQGDITSGAIRLDVQLFQNAAWQMEIDQRLPVEVQEPFLNSLRAAGILSKKGYARLLQDLKGGKIQDDIKFLKYIDRALLFDLHDYSLDPYDYFPKIHAAVSQMLTQTGVANFTWENFALELVKNAEYSGDESYQAIASVNINGKLYKQSSFYTTAKDHQDFIGRIESEEFLNLFNKILRDQGSVYRLYEIKAFSDNLGIPGLDHSRFGVIALTENQAKVYFQREDFHQETRLTTDRIEEILSLLEKIGLLNHLTQEQITTGQQKIRQSYITHPHDLLQAFPHLVVTVEWESGNLDKPYQELTYELVAASRGAFIPTDISNEFDGKNQIAAQSFTLNGRRYSKKLEYNNDFLDPEFFSFIQQIVEQTVSDGRFYPLYQDSDNIVGYIFLTNEQQRVLDSEGFITTNNQNR
jgi:ribosomal protein L19E/predicted transcriptional regulator